jgi:hypothetical protein
MYIRSSQQLSSTIIKKQFKTFLLSIMPIIINMSQRFWNQKSNHNIFYYNDNLLTRLFLQL